MITWHGLADPLILPNGTVDYYEKVMAADPGVQDYYRFFEAPGAGHCFGGIGPLRNDALGFTENVGRGRCRAGHFGCYEYAHQWCSTTPTALSLPTCRCLQRRRLTPGLVI